MPCLYLLLPGPVPLLTKSRHTSLLFSNTTAPALARTGGDRAGNSGGLVVYMAMAVFNQQSSSDAAGLAAGFGRGLDFGLGGAFGSIGAGGTAATAGFGLGLAAATGASTGFALRTQATFDSLYSCPVDCSAFGAQSPVRQTGLGGGGRTGLHSGSPGAQPMLITGQPGVPGMQTGSGHLG